MSCMLVSDKDIDAMLTIWFGYPFYFKGKRYIGNAEDLTKLGKILKKENIKSYKFRYENVDEEDIDYNYKYDYLKLSPIQVLKVVDFYEYQSCEHDKWKQSDAYELCNITLRKAIRALNGYEDANWGIRN